MIILCLAIFGVLDSGFEIWRNGYGNVVCCIHVVYQFIYICLPMSPPEDEADNPILLSEVEATIKRLKPGKPWLWWHSCQAATTWREPLARVLQSIYKETWRQEWLPEEWMKSVIVTLPKKGDLGLCSNCRTLSPINHACKVLLLILLKRLKDVWNSNYQRNRLNSEVTEA